MALFFILLCFFSSVFIFVCVLCCKFILVSFYTLFMLSYVQLFLVIVSCSSSCIAVELILDLSINLILNLPLFETFTVIFYCGPIFLFVES